MDDNDQPPARELNTLLEQMRASVEMLVALTQGATELYERETLADMGVQEVAFCSALHEWIAALGSFVSHRIAADAQQVLARDRYDDRLLAFAAHQRAVAALAQTVDVAAPPPELAALLEEIATMHLASGNWAERRAAAFAASRELDFDTGRAKAQAGADTGTIANPAKSGLATGSVARPRELSVDEAASFDGEADAPPSAAQSEQ